MLLRILRFVFGYVSVEISGFAPERFMNLIIQYQIVVWDVSTTESGYRFYTGRKNLIKMKPYLHKTNMKIKILNRYGIPFLIRKYKKRSMFLIGFAIAALLLYVLSLFIWEVRVTGEDQLVAASIRKRIEDSYIPIGTRKETINCTKLEQQLRADFSEIAWISCELKGTVLTIYLEEGIAPAKKEQDNKEGDIIAAKDAVITKMITRQGTPLVKVKDTVKKGDVLISGTVYIYDDNNEILETNYIQADGDIYGTTNVTYEDCVNLQYYKKNYSKDSKSYYSFYVGNYCFTPIAPKSGEKNIDCYTQIHKMRILHDYYLPIGYKKMKVTPYSLQSMTRTEADAKKILKKHFKDKIQKFKEKKVEIIQNNVTIEKVNEKMIAKGTLTVNEPIASFCETAQNHLEKIQE